MSEWIGVDFDGTLVKYDGPSMNGSFGEPIMPMVERVRAWLKEGVKVRIVTARVNSRVEAARRYIQILIIQNFCEQMFGQKLEVTSEKDFEMLALWDDRAVSVESNTGRIRSER